jgi:phosphatidylinositol glycan class N
LLGIQTGFTILSILVTRSSVAALQAKKGLPLGNQVLGWAILVISLLTPLAHQATKDRGSHYLHRLVVLFLTFAPTFIILTISYESLFYAAFCALLVAWAGLEQAVYLHTASPAESAGQLQETKKTPGHRALTLADLRTACFFLTLLQSAFFSTGNIASVSSFSLDSVYRLIPIFDPFSQGALLMLKLMIPFALISAVLSILTKMLGLGEGGIVTLVMGLAEYNAVRMFWMVRDEGSWLEIGSSISFFVITGLLGVFVAALEGVGWLWVGGVNVGDSQVEDVQNGEVKEVMDGVNGVAEERKAMLENAKSNGKTPTAEAPGFDIPMNGKQTVKV